MKENTTVDVILRYSQWDNYNYAYEVKEKKNINESRSHATNRQQLAGKVFLYVLVAPASDYVEGPTSNYWLVS